MRAVLREPLVHFLLIGGLLLLARQPLEPWLFPETVEVSPQQQAALAHQWRSQTGRTPDEAEMQRLISQHVDEELLYREARRLGLHVHDPVVRARLVRNMRFVNQDSETGEDALIEAATQLGMLDSDLVVRRRLVQRMRHRLESQVEVTESAVRSYYEQHPEEFRQPDRYQLQHILYKTQRPGRPAEAVAHEALQALRENRPAPAGDPFLLTMQFSHISAGELDAQLGTAASSALANAKPGEWFGPVSSVFGQHLFMIEKIMAGNITPYAEVRSRIVAMLYATQEAAHVQQTLADLRSRYRIQVAPGVTGESA